MATCDNLVRRHVLNTSPETDCIFCHSQMEDLEHILFLCEKTGEIWNAFLRWIGKSSALHHNAKEHFLAFIGLGNKAETRFLTGLWISIVWSIWKERNNCIFKQGVWNKDKLVLEIKMKLWCWKMIFKLEAPVLDLQAWLSLEGILS
ncbi:uncharacterized protein LOC131009848 [Salvia miltiorrhiza]|uniref:uncharacterized protein LOC131009848 n=1 Tax=Salvia miltiorrhiza TaxID=226208 RepID=UPI0025ACC76F|nr:uncharacterized protein LOC131009848 [Salvia miltiorrhiza]